MVEFRQSEEFIFDPHSIDTETFFFLSVPKVIHQQLEQILNEHPPIRKLYSELVMTKISPEEFWSRFFQSSYYFQMTGRSPPPGADEAIFPDFDPELLLKVSNC